MGGEEDCEAQGSGWGTVHDQALSVLILAPSARTQDAHDLARALSIRHRPQVLIEDRRGPRAWLLAARVAQETKATFIHAISYDGIARATLPTALGGGRHAVIDLGSEALPAILPKALIRALDKADAVLLGSEEQADAVRQAGVERDLYVLARATDPADDQEILRALEIVYGRVVGSDGEIPEQAPDGPQLVQIGAAKKSPHS